MYRIAIFTVTPPKTGETKKSGLPEVFGKVAQNGCGTAITTSLHSQLQGSVQRVQVAYRLMGHSWPKIIGI